MINRNAIARARGKRCAFIRVVRRGRDSMDSLLFGVEEQDESSVPDSVLKSLLLQVDVYNISYMSDKDGHGKLCMRKIIF